MKLILPGLLLTSLLLQAASFEAVSFKRSDAPAASGSGFDTDGPLIRMQNVTLKQFMMNAYGVPEAQILGVPKSMDDLRYDVVARADHSPGMDKLMAMLQLAGYSLTVAKTGVKAAPSMPGEPSGTAGSRGRVDAKGCFMSRLPMRLSKVLIAPVVDMTDETRKFDFALQWTPGDMQAKAAAPDAPQGPSLFTALQEQLGLKLESRKVSADDLLIGHVELSSEN